MNQPASQRERNLLSELRDLRLRIAENRLILQALVRSQERHKAKAMSPTTEGSSLPWLAKYAEYEAELARLREHFDRTDGKTIASLNEANEWLRDRERQLREWANDHSKHEPVTHDDLDFWHGYRKAQDDAKLLLDGEGR